MGRRARAKVHGIVAVDKPAGPTSRAVLNRVGRMFSERRCGHAGTLDPSATGVLVVAFCEATKVVRWLVAGGKSYRATVRFGSATDSDDAAGEVIAEAPLPEGLGPDRLLAAVRRELGEFEQLPPVVSALRRDGVRDHVRARRGETVERTLRRVRLDDVRLVSWRDDLAVFELDCGPGFYVRAWARDLGEALGSAAHLVALRRTRASGRHIDDAWTLEELEQMSAEERTAVLLAPGSVLADRLPTLWVDTAVETDLRHGKRPLAPWSLASPGADAVMVRSAPDDRLLCIARATLEESPADSAADPGEEIVEDTGQTLARLVVIRGFAHDVVVR